MQGLLLSPEGQLVTDTPLLYFFSDSDYSLGFMTGMLFKILQAADQHISVIPIDLIFLPLETIKGITKHLGLC